MVAGLGGRWAAVGGGGWWWVVGGGGWAKKNQNLHLVVCGKTFCKKSFFPKDDIFWVY